MKKIFITFIIGLICFTSCTSNQRARMYGGSTTIELPHGQKLVEVTWKNNNLWYLTEPMDSDYVPKVKTFSEDSNFGALEGVVIFVESN